MNMIQKQENGLVIMKSKSGASLIANKRQINSSQERYVTAITYLTKATRCGISVITIEIEFVKPDKRYCAKQKISTDN